MCSRLRGARKWEGPAEREGRTSHESRLLSSLRSFTVWDGHRLRHSGPVFTKEFGFRNNKFQDYSGTAGCTVGTKDCVTYTDFHSPSWMAGHFRGCFDISARTITCHIMCYPSGSSCPSLHITARSRSVYICYSASGVYVSHIHSKMEDFKFMMRGPFFHHGKYGFS